MEHDSKTAGRLWNMYEISTSKGHGITVGGKLVVDPPATDSTEGASH